VYLNSNRCATPDNAIKPENRGKTDIEILVGFWGGVLDMGFLQKCFREGEGKKSEMRDGGRGSSHPAANHQSSQHPTANRNGNGISSA
jgi:hypothetical protein